MLFQLWNVFLLFHLRPILDHHLLWCHVELCDVGDVEDMAQKSIHILDKDNLIKFKEAALDRAKTYDLENILPMYESYYAEVVETFKEAVTSK